MAKKARMGYNCEIDGSWYNYRYVIMPISICGLKVGIAAIRILL
jgi:hypothetical protein